MTQRNLYIAAYDISDPKRMVRALRVLKSYALGRQKSVFECYLDRAERRNLLFAIKHILDPVEDRFFLVRIAPRGPVHTLGIGVAPSDPAWFYVG